MRIAIALPGLHRVNRGAETAFQALGTALGERGHDVTLFGAGEPRPEQDYEFVSSRSIRRERFEPWPSFPPLRDSFRYEELTWIPGFLRAFRPDRFDVTLTCSFPFTNLALRLPRRNRPAHVFVTENGDWPAFNNGLEYRWFSCDGIVCTNAEYHHRNKDRWASRLIPNGVDLAAFRPGEPQRERFALSTDAPTVLMVSALTANKRVDAGIRAVAEIPGAVLVVAGDGVLRTEIDELGNRLLGDRYRRLSVESDQMPDLYRSSNVVLHTTLSESFGNVYVEALASGVPVVAHDSDHTRWIFGDSPLLVDTLSQSVTVAAIERALATSPVDDSRVVTDISRFTWSSVAEHYDDFLTHIVNQRAHGVRAR